MRLLLVPALLLCGCLVPIVVGANAVCTPGADQSCNESPTMSAFAGHCESTGVCVCNPGFTPEPLTGRCAAAVGGPGGGGGGAGGTGGASGGSGGGTAGGGGGTDGGTGGGGASWQCTPGQDQTCNENLGMSAFAGVCQQNGTCLCQTGFRLAQSGRCVAGGCAGLAAPVRVTRFDGGSSIEYVVNDHLPDDGAVYLARLGTNGLSGWHPDGRIARATPGGTELPLTQAEKQPTNLQIVGTDLYFLEWSTATIKRVPLAGGAPVSVFTPSSLNPRIDQFTVLNGAIYWARFGSENSSGSVYRTTIATGATVALAAYTANITAFRVDQTGTYWIAEQHAAGGGGTWWTTLTEVKHGSDTPTELYHVTSTNWALSNLASDATSLYFYDRGSTSVTRLDKSSSANNPVLDGFEPLHLTLDGSTLYWLQNVCLQSSGGICLSWEGRVMKGPATGTASAGSGSLIATIAGGINAQALRVDDTCVYWDDPNIKGVFKMAK
jgi:hypothetical protein